MKDQIRDALRRSKADYTEIRLEERESTQVAYRGEDLETASAVIDRGGIVRCLVASGGWGVATFNDLTDLSHRVQQAYEGARAIQGEPVELAPTTAVEDSVVVPLRRDFRGISMTEKVALVEAYNSILQSQDPRIVDTQVFYRDVLSRVTFANSEGTLIEEERPDITVFLVAVARENGNVQRAVDGVAKAAGYEVVLGQEGMASEVAERATALLSALKVQGGRYTVICDQKLAGVFVHEAFGHLSEADFVYENPRAQEMMVLGRRFGKEFLTIVDDGTIPGLRGSHRYDDEGTRTQRTELVKNGILTGRLHSRETAAKMGEAPTGNARATGYRYRPIVRMTNTYIEPRTLSFEDMIAGIDLGIYARSAFGGQTALENFSFSAAYAYMIRDGQVAEMVRDVILAGNLFSTLESIDAVGDDLEFWETGSCGKGQGGLPVATGSPHIRIRDVIIGGD